MALENEMFLREKALIIRRNIIKMVGAAGSGHPGGSLSAAEIMTYLYFSEMDASPENIAKKGRDRFVLSKGHAAPVLYAALAEKGFFPTEELWRLRKIDSPLQGHPDMKKVPGVEMSTGSLATGFSAAVGMALAYRLDEEPGRIFALLGDGELQEGQVWEAAMAAAHYKLSNLIAILDYNGLQIDGAITDVLSPEPIADKWRAFGWRVIEADGHDFTSIDKAMREANAYQAGPVMIICRTIKGKGVSYMENVASWHGNAPNAAEMEQALEELGEVKVEGGMA